MNLFAGAISKMIKPAHKFYFQEAKVMATFHTFNFRSSTGIWVNEILSIKELKMEFRKLFLCLITSLIVSQNVWALNVSNIEKLTGLKGKLNEKEGVFKVSYPRNDLKVTVQGVKINPAMGFTAWAAFTEGKGHTMVMG